MKKGIGKARALDIEVCAKILRSKEGPDWFWGTERQSEGPHR